MFIFFKSSSLDLLSRNSLLLVLLFQWSFTESTQTKRREHLHLDSDLLNCSKTIVMISPQTQQGPVIRRLNYSQPVSDFSHCGLNGSSNSGGLINSAMNKTRPEFPDSVLIQSNENCTVPYGSRNRGSDRAVVDVSQPISCIWGNRCQFSYLFKFYIHD